MILNSNYKPGSEIEIYSIDHLGAQTQRNYLILNKGVRYIFYIYLFCLLIYFFFSVGNRGGQKYIECA